MPPAAPAAASAATPASAPRARRAPPLWKLEIDAPDGLDTLLGNYLDLARYQKEEAAEDAKEGARVSRGELRRLVAAAPDQARSLLEAQGYFAAQIRTSLSDEVPGQPLLIKLEVQPGLKTRVSRVQMLFEGDLDTAVSKDDAGAKALVAELEAEWALPVGTIFTQPAWSGAKNGMLARMRAEGYPLASWSGTSATVDAQQKTAALVVVADSGPVFHFGEIRIEGLKVQPASAIMNLATFSPGQVYKEQSLLDFQERVQKLNVFDSVFINMDPDQALAHGAPVTVQVHESTLQQATVGIGISGDTGPRVSVEHLNRHVFGYDWMAKTKLQLGTVDSSLQIDLNSMPYPGRRRWLASMQLAREEEDTSDSVTTSQRYRFGQGREGDRLERLPYVEYQSAKVTSTAGDTVSDASAISATMQYTWRDVDSPTLPTQGITALTSVGLGRSFATTEKPGFFSRLYGRVTWYQPLFWGWDATTRYEAGRVLSRDGDAVSVPDTLLFRAGGDDSVRGYGYRSMGIDRNGTLVGGRAMSTFSAELTHPIVKKYPAFLGAVFFDVGGVANQFTDIDPQRGYGVGVHWRSPVGPLKLDIAYGEAVKAVRVHFSVGITL